MLERFSRKKRPTGRRPSELPKSMTSQPYQPSETPSDDPQSALSPRVERAQRGPT
jgi:hypothetical protein